jgi:hypothetical protein
MDTSFLDNYPIYFVSSHGEYQLGDRDDEPLANSFIVPPNVYIFEMSKVGEVCLASADEASWELCQGIHREDFKNYFLKRGARPNRLKNNIFQNLTFYAPGDTIYTRYLKMGERTTNLRSNPADYRSFGFYKFNIGDPRFTYGDGNGTMILFANLMRSLQRDGSTFTSTEEVINRVIQGDRPAFQGGIFFISSCGAHGCDDMRRLCKTKISAILAHQRQQDIDLMGLITNNSRVPSLRGVTLDRGQPNFMPDEYYEESVVDPNNGEETYMNNSRAASAVRYRVGASKTPLRSRGVAAARLMAPVAKENNKRSWCQKMFGVLTCGLIKWL